MAGYVKMPFYINCHKPKRVRFCLLIIIICEVLQVYRKIQDNVQIIISPLEGLFLFTDEFST